MKTLIALLAFVLTSTAAEVISWNANPPGEGVTGYKVFWATSASGPWTVLGATSGLSLTNTAAGNFYYYVTATNDCCESDPSVVVHRPGSPQNPKVGK